MNLKNISLFSRWKPQATPAERLHELAMLAEKHPEKFDSVVVIYTERMKNGNTKTISINAVAEGRPALTTFDIVGIMECAKMDFWEEMGR